MKKLVLLIAAVFCGTANAQSSDYRNIVTVGTVSALASNRWTVGYMHELNEKIWLGAEVGVGARPIAFRMDDWITEFSSFEIRPEIYYSLAPDRKSKHFLSASLFYVNTQQHLKDGDFSENGANYTYDETDYQKTKKGVGVNYSFLMLKEGGRFGVMPKIGIGLPDVDIKYENTVGKTETQGPTDDFSLGLAGMNSDAGSHTRLNMYFDIKLFYRF
ncbi:hypothetical protein [Chryseobacterium sp.]|uniref:hypothetical protein n=1 Tax=Chryseobacterium sp. TaxID=1871047 RepID=UPI0011C77B87|nr:hypothetical protein [Chryseobacterium sp.]TXF79117.1 hypothetical protein FUA25_01620 [Chryseobacterium sp.]